MYLRNYNFVSDEQRKAVMAKLHSGSGTGRRYSSKSGSSWRSGPKSTSTRTVNSSLSQSSTSSATNDPVRAEIEKRIKMRSEGWTQRADGNWERHTPITTGNKSPSDNFFDEVKSRLSNLLPSSSDLDALLAASAAAGPIGAVPAALEKAASWGDIGLSALKSALAGGIAKEIADTRKDPYLSENADHYLALGETAAKIASAVTGLAAGKDALRRMFPDTASTLGSAAEWIGEQLSAAGVKTASMLPESAQVGLSKAKSAYDALADFTGAELPQFAKGGDILDRALASIAQTDRAAELRGQAQSIAEAAIAKSDALLSGAETGSAARDLEQLATKMIEPSDTRRCV